MRARWCAKGSVWLCVLVTTIGVSFAQQVGPPDGPPPDLPESRDGNFPQPASVKKRLSQMSQRYGLTPPQQEAVRPLLESERKQMESLRKDDSLEPGEMFTRSMAIHQVANTKIEDVLTPPQKSKFEQDEAKMEDSRRNRKERMAGPEDMPPPPGSGPPLN